MTSIRSSVRPKSSKQPWGTILEPEFGMGYQKMTGYEVEQTVHRLNIIPPERRRIELELPKLNLSRSQITGMVSSWHINNCVHGQSSSFQTRFN